ncbi:RNase H family protein [Curtobacterium citreum]
MTKSRPVVVIATDASVRADRASAAWATRRGEHATASLWPATDNTDTAEATAIVLALQAADPNRGVHIITDSLMTVTALRRTATHRYPDGVKRHLDVVNSILDIARARRAPAHIHWQRAHTGGDGTAALQHAADRLAFHAGRGSLHLLTGDTDTDFAAAARTRWETTPAGDCNCRWRAPADDTDQYMVLLRPAKLRASHTAGRIEPSDEPTLARGTR